MTALVDPSPYHDGEMYVRGNFPFPFLVDQVARIRTLFLIRVCELALVIETTAYSNAALSSLEHRRSDTCERLRGRRQRLAAGGPS